MDQWTTALLVIVFALALFAFSVWRWWYDRNIMLMTQGQHVLWLERRSTPPYWWPDPESFIQIALAIVLSGMVCYILYQLLNDAIKLEQGQRDLLNISLGIILGEFKGVCAFAWGKSSGDKSRREAMTRSMETKDKIIADSANTATDAALKAATVVAPFAAAAAAPMAAAVAAPAAAAAAAPPAAEVAAPPAARDAVDDALAERGIHPQPNDPTKPKE